jgi:hypothetical protein
MRAAGESPHLEGCIRKAHFQRREKDLPQAITDVSTRLCAVAESIVIAGKQWAGPDEFLNDSVFYQLSLRARFPVLGQSSKTESGQKLVIAPRAGQAEKG